MSKKQILIGITGTNASGKGTVADYLKKKGYEYLSLSDIIRDELASRSLRPTRENMINEGNRLRKKYGAGILAERLSLRIDGNTVIDSIRNPAEVQELRKLNNFFLLSVDAPVEFRFQRAMKRGRAENAKTLEEFIDIEKKEKTSKDQQRQQLDECMKIADEKIINDGSIKGLYEKIEKILKKRGC